MVHVPLTPDSTNDCVFSTNHSTIEFFIGAEVHRTVVAHTDMRNNPRNELRTCGREELDKSDAELNIRSFSYDKSKKLGNLNDFPSSKKKQNVENIQPLTHVRVMN